ncbi:MAG: DUF2703 domain-containing protein [Chloroflexi bacterium]|nr:MAG: DUF2703 domain-containing protein [Chloroflexota bacterium]
MQITFLYYEDCPSHDTALERLKTVLAEKNVQADVQVVKIETEAQAQKWRFIGSPTILVDGRDIDPPGPETVPALTCRAYRLEDGRISPLPSKEMIRRALKTAERDVGDWRLEIRD